MKLAFFGRSEKEFDAGMLLEAIWAAREVLTMKEMAWELARGLRPEEFRELLIEMDMIETMARETETETK